MANPQREDENIHIKNGNYTRIHNRILEELMKIHLSGYEIKIILAIWRKTYGWRKKEDFITFKQFQEMTNLPKSEVSRTLARLKRKHIVVENYNSRPVKYKFNKYFTKWKELEKTTTSCRKLHQPLEKTTTGDVENYNSAFSENNTQKHDNKGTQRLAQKLRTKETITKETTTKEKDIKERTMMWSQIENLLSQFPEEIKDMVDEYIELATLENKTKRITLQKRRRLINELHLLWSSCNSSITQKDFEKALRITINKEAPNVNYVKKVMKGVMNKRSLRLKGGENKDT